MIRLCFVWKLFLLCFVWFGRFCFVVFYKCAQIVSFFWVWMEIPMHLKTIEYESIVICTQLSFDGIGEMRLWFPCLMLEMWKKTLCGNDQIPPTFGIVCVHALLVFRCCRCAVDFNYLRMWNNAAFRMQSLNFLLIKNKLNSLCMRTQQINSSEQWGIKETSVYKNSQQKAAKQLTTETVHIELIVSS